MTQTDRILGNIGAIKTLLENFPMGLFERDGKIYTSSFEFIMDVLRSCGVNDQTLISYIIGKIYGFEGQLGYTIDGLYEKIKQGDINIDMQNPFISGLETSIKSILMALFTSIFTCSALPILPDGVFDYDSYEKNGNKLMPYNVELITRKYNDPGFKILVPISTIDIMGMFSISPTTSYGSLYYSTDGHDVYYKKEYVTSSWTMTSSCCLTAGDSYSGKVNTFNSEYVIKIGYSFPNGYIDIFDKNGTQTQIPVDLNVVIEYLEGNTDTTKTKEILIHQGEDGVASFTLQSYIVDGNNNYYSTEIVCVTVNGYEYGCIIGSGEDKSWVYITMDNASISRWEEHGAEIDKCIFGYSRADETCVKVLTAETDGQYDCEVECSSTTLVYKSIVSASNIDSVIRYSYVPDYVYEEDPDEIVCYEGMNPNLVYRANDMNAFLWYCYNRFNIVNQTEENHLMWDSRISASKNGIVRNNTQWNDWYSSKDEEGKEFKHNGNDNSDMLYPIIQVERHSYDEFLIRIPAQRYYAPKKREELANSGETSEKIYHNASVYRFDWEYLKNIQILNPKLLLTRLLEHIIGLSLDVKSSLYLNVSKQKINAVLSKAVKSIIEANDMEVEDCWKSFSNDDYNDLLEEMMLNRYKAVKTSSESSPVKYQDINEYINQLDKINQNVTSQGTTEMITKMVTNVMMTDGSEESTKFSFDFGFNADMLNNIIWAIVMPIVESLFTPQVMLLMMINFQLLGIININEINNDYTKVINLLLNKILGLVKSLVLYIKDKIISLLLELLTEKLIPMLTEMGLLLYLEMVTDWLIILLNAVKCIPLLGGLERSKPIGYIEDVDYADIVNEQNIPESSSEC